MAAAPKEKMTNSVRHLEAVPRAHSSHDDEIDLSAHTHKKGEEGEPWLVSYADMMTLLMGFFALIASFSKPNAKEFDKVAAAASQYFGAQYQAPYEKLGNSLKHLVKENKIDDKVQIDVGNDGITLTFNGTLFFDSGTYVIKSEASSLLDKLTTTVKKEATNYKAMIEGHTDDTPIHQEIIGSNWELSGVRAARIAQYFEQKGFTKAQLTIMGWGETRPIAPNLNKDGSPNSENRAKNRRVVIRLYKDLPN